MPHRGCARQHCWRVLESSYSRVLGSQFRLLPAAPYAPSVLPQCSLLLSRCSPPCSLGAPPAPAVLPLKRPCSLSWTSMVITNPKFEAYIIYYIRPELRIGNDRFWFGKALKGAEREYGGAKGSWFTQGDGIRHYGGETTSHRKREVMFESSLQTGAHR